MKKNGFTLIELLVCFVIIAIVSISLFKTILSLQKKQIENVSYNQYIAFSSALNNKIGKDLNDNIIVRFYSCGDNCYVINYEDIGEITLSIDKVNNTITYGTFKEKLPNNYFFYGDIGLNLKVSEDNNSSYNSMFTLSLPIKSKLSSNYEDIKYYYMYDNNENEIFNDMFIRLTINPSGGTYNGNSTNITYNLLPNASMQLLTPTKEGHVFNEWTGPQSGYTLENDIVTIENDNITLTANWLTYEDMFTYTVNGNPGIIDTDYSVIDDGDGNWRIKFLTTGIFTPHIDMIIDAFLVGGGSGGGGSGYTNTYYNKNLFAETNYTVTIGAGGASNGNPTSIEIDNTTYSALGGSGINGGSGGGTRAYCSRCDQNTTIHGGVGGTDGSNGNPGGLGQRTTTREFGEADGDRYAAGGGSASYYSGRHCCGGYNSSGYCEGYTTDSCGASASSSGTIDVPLENSGSGGAGGTGANGIVVIRNKQYNLVKTSDNTTIGTYTGWFTIEGTDANNWKIKFLSSGTFVPYLDMTIDAFLVGGGSGAVGVAGGGSGYTSTETDINLIANNDYTITIGKGGLINTNGNPTSIEIDNTTYSALGGSGINGGSGGGRGAYCNTCDQNTTTHGGIGGTDGSDGNPGGEGQESTTREFGEVDGDRYAAGGGSAGYHNASHCCGGFNSSGWCEGYMSDSCSANASLSGTIDVPFENSGSGGKEGMGADGIVVMRSS